jgi:hypothetical protein
MTMDFNYTWAKSIDMASRAENAGTFNGFMQNPYQPRQFRAVSDFDQRHIYNAFVIYDLPFGKNKRFGSGVNSFVDGVIGGWTVSPTWQMATELPTSVLGTGVWPTNWNVTSRAVPRSGATRAPLNTKTKNSGPPNMFTDPNAARGYFDYSLPGESGPRNIMRQDGTFNINLALAKRIKIPYLENHSIQIRAEAFNITNAVRFIDPNINLTQPNTFGRYQNQANAPRQMQFALRYDF